MASLGKEDRMPDSRHAAHKKRLSAGFLAVILFKYLKAAAFLLVGIAVLRFVRLSAHGAPMEIAEFLNVNPERENVQRLSAFFSEITPGQVQAIGAAAVAIGLIFAAEGTLLAVRIWWATYFTIILTALGIPLEIYEIFGRPTQLRNYVFLAVNAAILLFLWRRRNEFRAREGRDPSAARPEADHFNPSTR